MGELQRERARGADQHNIINTLALDNNKVVINELAWHEQNGTAGENVLWGYEGGLIHLDGGRHSPAVSLLHELGHFYWDMYDPLGVRAKEMGLWNPYDADGIKKFESEQQMASGGYYGFKNYEEMWVIKSVEHFAAKMLGQSQRSSHGKLGKFRADGLFSTKSTEEHIYTEDRRH
ncbi:MAG: hypothetical protein ACKV1O_05995 [Saprospiraceae bacterium]